jgi:hypothetical protein
MRDGNGILLFSSFRKRKDIMDSPTLGACPSEKYSRFRIAILIIPCLLADVSLFKGSSLDDARKCLILYVGS